jgi:hypothetical protein
MAIQPQEISPILHGCGRGGVLARHCAILAITRGGGASGESWIERSCTSVNEEFETTTYTGQVSSQTIVAFIDIDVDNNLIDVDVDNDLDQA